MASSCPTAISSALAAVSTPSPSPSPPSLSNQARFGFSTRSWRRSRMSSDRSPSPPLPDRRVVLGCGAMNVDFLAAVASYPKPDDKIRSTSLEVQGGGNAGNALTCAARLGLNPRLISKVVDDAQGRSILAELEADGVDTSFLVLYYRCPITYSEHFERVLKKL